MVLRLNHVTSPLGSRRGQTKGNARGELPERRLSKKMWSEEHTGVLPKTLVTLMSDRARETEGRMKVNDPPPPFGSIEMFASENVYDRA